MRPPGWLRALAPLLVAACAAGGAPLRVVGEIPVHEAPHGLLVADDGRRVLVAESGAGTVATIDLAYGDVVERVPAGETPLDLVPDGGDGFWVTQFRGSELLHLGPGGRVLGRLEVGAGPSLFTQSAPGGRRGLVCERSDRFLTFDPTAGAVVQEFTTGARPFPAAITRDGVLAFVPDADGRTVTVLDLLNWETAATVPLEGRPRGGDLSAGDVSYVVATTDPDALVWINTATYEVTRVLGTGVGPAPFSVATVGDGPYGVVNDAGGATVSLVDLERGEVVGRAAVGLQPIVVRAHPDGRHVLVSSELANTVTVLELPPPPPPRPFVAPNEVVLLGTIHDGHLTSERYGLDVLEAIVRAVDPDVVLVEIPPNRMAAALEGFRETGELSEPRARRFPEYAQVLFPLSRELDFEIVPTAAWTEPMARYRREALERIGSDPLRAKEWAEYQDAVARAEAAIETGGGDDPRWIHTDAYDRAAEIELETYARLFGDELGPGGWETINRAHWRNIARALDERRGRGLRVLVTFGAYHKGWFLRRLRAREDVEVLDVTPFVDVAEASLGGRGELPRAEQRTEAGNEGSEGGPASAPGDEPAPAEDGQPREAGAGTSASDGPPSRRPG